MRDRNMSNRSKNSLLSLFLALMVFCAVSLFPQSIEASDLVAATNGNISIMVIHSADSFNSYDKPMGAGILVGALQGGVAKKFCTTNTVSTCVVNVPYGYYDLKAYPSQSVPPFFHWVCSGSTTIDVPNRSTVVRCRITL